MKKTALFLLLLSLAVMVQSCKKKTYVVPTLEVFRIHLHTAPLIDVEFDKKGKNGYVISETGIWKTIDTGKAWRRVNFLDTNTVFLKLCVIDSQWIYVTAKNYVYNKYLTYRSTDAGLSFLQMNTGSKEFHATEFITSSTGFMESTGQVYITVDGGMNWSLTGFPSALGTKMDLIEFRDDSYGIAMSFSNNRTFVTQNSGVTWHEKTNLAAPASAFRNIKFSKEVSLMDMRTIGLATGASDNGWFWSSDTAHTWNGGKNIAIPDEKHPKMEVADLYKGSGYGAGDHTLYYTSDNGINWQPRYDQNGESLPETFTEIFAVNPKLAFATTKEGTLIQITLGNK
jgi:photosystem II stability/assembly factor-like uncharacterized protein